MSKRSMSKHVITLTAYDKKHDLDLEAKVEVEVLYIPPWKGSLYTCPSDVDWYGTREVNGVEILSLKCFSPEGIEVNPPKKYDFDEFWSDKDVFEELECLDF